MHPHLLAVVKQEIADLSRHEGPRAISDSDPRNVHRPDVPHSARHGARALAATRTSPTPEPDPSGTHPESLDPEHRTAPTDRSACPETWEYRFPRTRLHR